MSQVELNIVDAKGKKVGTKAVSADVFSTAVKKHLLHQVVRWQRAKKRAGTHSVQTRAEMTGGGKKPWKQKGTGNARSGSNTSPLWVGGGIAHGPKPRDYEFRLNKKERLAAIKSAISARTNEEKLVVLKSFSLSSVKTKSANEIIRTLGIAATESVLVVSPKGDTNTELSLRNIKKVTLVHPDGLNVYDILTHKYLLITEEALSQVEQRFSENSNVESVN
ncbi:MAG: 50S ribosomal protein L4 [Proteobacteria bacterium]|nr:50S ribosomal protein L4 [Pseudomonadota bacterium]